MVTRRFLAWTGVGLLAVVTIPTLAAPHLAKLLARRPAATNPAKPAKPLIAKKTTRPSSRPTTAASATTKPTTALAQAQPAKKAVRIKKAPKPAAAAVQAAARIEKKPKKSNPQLTARTLLH